MFAVYTFIMSALDFDVRGSWELFLEVLLHLSLAVLFFAVFALCIESIRAKWNKATGWAVYAFFALLSLLMSFINSDLTENSHKSFWMWLKNIRDSLGSGTVMLYIGGLLVKAALLAVYFSYSRNIRQRFNDHVINACSKLFFTSIIYGVIQVGVLLLTVIVSLLLFDDAFEYIGPILILINGLFYAPAIVCALIKQNEKANIFIQILVRYINLIIVMLAYVIIYIYMIKLVVTTSVPSNSVYAILTALFVISMTVTYMCTTFEEKGFLQKFAYNAPLIFAPFILMQCYTIIVRIRQYGLTPMRYFGVAFIAFETVYIAYYTYMHRHEHEIAGRNLLLIICAFLVITIFIPGINARALSMASAKRTLSSYLEKYRSAATITGSEYIHASAAYDLLDDDDFGTDRIRKYFDSMDDKEVSDMREGAKNAKKAAAEGGDGMEDTSYTYPRGAWYSAELMQVTGADRIDISGFDTIRYVNIAPPEDADNDPDNDTAVDTSSLEIRSYDSNMEVPYGSESLMNIDLSDYCKKIMELSARYDEGTDSYDEFQKKCTGISIIDINENARLYITNADISYNRHEIPVSVNINGYLLTDD